MAVFLNILLISVITVNAAIGIPISPNDVEWNFLDLELISSHDSYNNFNAERDVIFRLFTRENPTEDEIVVLNDEDSLLNSSYNLMHPTRFIIHGYGSYGGFTGGVSIRNAYLERGNFNVFAVDWTAGSNDPIFARARERVMEVGTVTARFIEFLIENGMPIEAITVVGMSLGAHVAGITGKRIGPNRRLPIIIGLDPARLLVSLDHPEERLAHDDAIYVEVITTNGGEVGFFNPLGRATFYPNMGRVQPGCVTDVNYCSHFIAADYFAESITSTRGFWATQCSEFLDIIFNFCSPVSPMRVMGGEPANGAANGVYYVSTNAQSPYAQGL